MDIQEILENEQLELRQRLEEEDNSEKRFLLCVELLQIDERLARLDK